MPTCTLCSLYCICWHTQEMQGITLGNNELDDKSVSILSKLSRAQGHAKLLLLKDLRLTSQAPAHLEAVNAQAVVCQCLSNPPYVRKKVTSTSHSDHLKRKVAQDHMSRQKSE